MDKREKGRGSCAISKAVLRRILRRKRGFSNLRSFEPLKFLLQIFALRDTIFFRRLILKKIFVFLAIAITTSLLFAETSIRLNGIDYSVPDDVANLYYKNQHQIDNALKGVNNNEIKDAIDEINRVYKDILDDFGTLTPLTDVENGLNNFSKDLAPAISNAKLIQNVWAEACLRPNIFHKLSI